MSRDENAEIVINSLVHSFFPFAIKIFKHDDMQRWFDTVIAFCSVSTIEEMKSLVKWFNYLNINEFQMRLSELHGKSWVDTENATLCEKLVKKTNDLHDTVIARKFINAVKREETDAIRAHNRARNRAEARLAKEKARAELLAKASKLPMPSRRAPGPPSLPPKKKAPQRPR